MGKGDRNQPKLTFEQRKPKGAESAPPETSTQAAEGSLCADIREMLGAMEKGLQDSMSAIGSKIDALSFRMDRMSERVDKHAERLDMAERRLTEAEEAQTEWDKDRKQFGRLLQVIQDKTEDLEARSRRSNIRITGVAESTNTGKMELFVEKLLHKLLGEDVFSPMFIVERAHRTLGPKPQPGLPPRPIIAKLLNYRDRDLALRLAREKGDLQFEGMNISLYPDFTARVQEERKRFAPYKKQMRDMGLDYAMLYPARLRINKQGHSHFFTDPADLKKSLKEWAKEQRNSPRDQRAEDEEAVSLEGQG